MIIKTTLMRKVYHCHSCVEYFVSRSCQDLLDFEGDGVEDTFSLTFEVTFLIMTTKINIENIECVDSLEK